MATTDDACSVRPLLVSRSLCHVLVMSPLSLTQLFVAYLQCSAVLYAGNTPAKLPSPGWSRFPDSHPIPSHPISS